MSQSEETADALLARLLGGTDSEERVKEALEAEARRAHVTLLQERYAGAARTRRPSILTFVCRCQLS